MLETVEIPVWALILGAFAFVLMVLERAFIPSVRWFFRGRINRAVARINDRLQLRLQPFKYTKRQVLVDRLTYDPDVMAAVESEAQQSGRPREVVAEEAARYAREIVPNFSAATYFWFGIRVARWLAQLFYRVRLGYADQERLANIDPQATVVFVMNHRSNMDYVLVTYLVAERSALSYAVGEWARMWPLQQLIKAMGAYFIRRRSRNPLYRRVLARYVQMATDGAVTQAVFPEGGLSRDGALGEPKLGILAYMVQGFQPESSREVLFVPVGLNYDRVIEDRTLTMHQTHPDGRPKYKMKLGSLLGMFFRHLRLRISGRFHKLGYATVSFGDPMSLTQFMAEYQGDDPTGALGDQLMARVGAVIPVLPVPLIATVMLEATVSISREDLISQATALRDVLVSNGAHFHLPRGDFEYAVDLGIRVLRERHLISGDDTGYQVVEAESGLLHYYANSIAHLPR